MENIKENILDSMKSLVQDGISITKEDYNGSNKQAFAEFSEANNYELNTVVEVFEENQDLLSEINAEFWSMSNYKL